MFKFTRKIFFISSIYIVGGFGLGLIILTTTDFRHNLSINYRGRLEQTGVGRGRLLNLSLSAVVDPTIPNRILVAREALNLEHFTYAKAILLGINTDEAKILLGNATLGEGDTLGARKIYTKIEENDKKTLYTAKTYYFEGDIVQGNKIILSNPPYLESCKLFILTQPIDKSVCAGLLDNDEEFKRTFNFVGTQAGYSLAYNELNKTDYTQLSFAILKEGQTRGLLSRDLIFELGRRYLEINDQNAAKLAYVAALDKDPYYPQTYRQLILISKNIGDLVAADSYETKLGALELK